MFEKNNSENYLSTNSLKNLFILQIILILGYLGCVFTIYSINTKTIEYLYNYSMLRYELIKDLNNFSFLKTYDLFTFFLIPTYIYITLTFCSVFKIHKITKFLLYSINSINKLFLSVLATIFIVFDITFYILTTFPVLGMIVNSSNYIQCTSNNTCKYLIYNIDKNNRGDKEVLSEIFAINNIAKRLQVIKPESSNINSIAKKDNNLNFNYVLNESMIVRIENVTKIESSNLIIPEKAIFNVDFHYGINSVNEQNCYLTLNTIKYNNITLDIPLFLNNTELLNNFNYFKSFNKDKRMDINKSFSKIYLNNYGCEKYNEILNK